MVAEEAGCELAEVQLLTRLGEDLGLDGDDFDFVPIQLAQRYGVDMSGYRWYHHCGQEGCNPLWFVLPPWWMKATKIPVRVADLVAAVESGQWSIEYPGDPVSPSRDWASALLSVLLVAWLAFLLLAALLA